MKIWLVTATTEASDHYYFAFKDKPSNEEIIKRVWEIEQAEDLDFYSDTTRVHMEEVDVD